MRAFLLRSVFAWAAAGLVTTFLPATTAAELAFTSASSPLVTAGTAADPGEEL